MGKLVDYVRGLRAITLGRDPTLKHRNPAGSGVERGFPFFSCGDPYSAGGRIGNA